MCKIKLEKLILSICFQRTLFAHLILFHFDETIFATHALLLKNGETMISFITIRGNEYYGWSVVKKTFPQEKKTSIILTADSDFVGSHCSNQNTAEVAAKKIAVLNSLPYVSENVSVITILPCDNRCYVPVELTSNDTVIAQGTVSQELQSAIKDAHDLALTRQLPFIVNVPLS